MDGNSVQRDSNIGTLSMETVLAVALLGVLAVLLVPLPTFLLDMLLAGNLGLSVLLMLITIGVTQPLEISVFPSLLLLLTLYRLSLNVATTRLILLDGDAGQLVSAFGHFVVGGNLVVGLVIFLILVVIQFIVITKGSSRVSEVAARFTLDAMPGKQMAIDAELNSGGINEAEARQRRQNLTRESEFYGAMDGASKFVRGDAIASLVITGINLVGGVIIGISQGTSIIDALHRYSVLTVGDGLVTQIPALLIATTAGILVTKATSKISLGREISTQMFAQHQPLLIGAVILGGIALMPGLPKFPFLLLAVGLVVVSRRTREQQMAPLTSTAVAKPAAGESTGQTLPVDEFVQADRAGLEIGVRLIPLVQQKGGKGLPDRIVTLRGELTRKHGVWVPAIRIRDNLRLGPDNYRILIAGNEVARGEVRSDMLMAIDPGGADVDLDGERSIDPAFGLPAKWIPRSSQQRAELKGYTVVDATTVLITHLGEVLKRYSHELLSREDLQRLLDRVKEISPSIVDELKPDTLRMGELHQILVLLLEERVPITNLPRILETLAHYVPGIRDPLALADRVRQSLGREITTRFRSEEGKVRVAVLDPRLEFMLRRSLRDGNVTLDPQQLTALIEEIRTAWQKNHLQQQELALLTDISLRRALRRGIERSLPDVSVLAYQEIPTDVQIEMNYVVRGHQLLDPTAEHEQPSA